MKRILIVCALLLAPGVVGAHPCFEGIYTAQQPCPVQTRYEFSSGRFLGAGVWTGCLRVFVGGQLVATGTYELRMFTASLGTVSIREGEGIATVVGSFDMQERSIVYMGTTFRR